jgi:hypothetical protein
MWSHLFWLPDFSPGAFWPTEGEASRVPRRRSEKFKHRFFATAKNQVAPIGPKAPRTGKDLPMTRQYLPIQPGKFFHSKRDIPAFCRKLLLST